jgi:ferrous iron transport protein A
MGLVEGVEVCVAFKAPFGDPIAIELNGTLLSLRRKEASLVNIRLLQT